MNCPPSNTPIDRIRIKRTAQESCLTSQCLAGRRIGELEVLQSEIQAWSEKTNTKQRGIGWQFTIENARTKLKKLYPKIKV